ncbi:MAG: hypothetical protein IPK82_08155 [Polyangiaceae bacterium]|nr:hypothetical protein [Polyangiaceae bacterium]
MKGLNQQWCMALALVAGWGLFAGCEPPNDDDPRLGDGGEGGTTEPPNGGNGGEGGTTPVCTGLCVNGPPSGFTGPFLYQITAPESLLPCPDVAPEIGFEGFADLQVEPHTCPTCSCGPAGCVLPEAMFASAAKCAGAEGAVSTVFDAPPGWEGTCTQENAIDAGLTCESSPCVQSVTVAAPTVESCKPAENGAAMLPKPSWKVAARECRIAPLDGDGCAPWGEVCAPAPPKGFDLCLYREGDDPAFECPEDYSRRVVVFAGVKDGRECSPCACGEPEGAACGALVKAYSDGACGVQIGATTVGLNQPGCFDVLSGSAVGSKDAFLTVEKPGSCAHSGGEPTGELAPSAPVTLCCQTEDLPR